MPDADAARLRAVPRPDEHLRRPRQPADARAPLRVARDRLRAHGRRARRRRSTPTPTTSSTSAAARTATSALCAQDLVETKRDALHAAADARRARPRRLRRLPAARPRLRARRRGDPRPRARRPARPSASDAAAADRQRRDRGRARRRRPAAGARGLREPRRPHAPRRRRAPARARAARARQHRRVGFEGVRRGGVIGTYLHGPLLPKNAWFADWLIAGAPARRARAARRRARGRRARGGARAAGLGAGR